MRARAVQDYDEAQFDALYICLALEEGPLEKLCDWLVELSIHLIRPAALQPTHPPTHPGSFSIFARWGFSASLGLVAVRSPHGSPHGSLLAPALPPISPTRGCATPTVKAAWLGGKIF